MRKLIFALLPLLVGCTNVQNKGNDSANPDSQNELVTFHLNAPPSKVEPLLLSELADSVSYVALETTKETLTKDAVQYGDLFYSVISNDERLLCFDKGGKFLHQIGRRGKGPEEYPWMDYYDCFQVDPTNNWIYVHSSNGSLVYDENGKFVKRLQGEMWSLRPNFVYNNLAYFAPYSCPFEIINGSDNQIVRNNHRMIEERKKYTNELYDKSLKKVFLGEGTTPVSCISNDALYYWSAVFNDTVIMAKGKEVKPFCRITPKNICKPEDIYSGDINSTLLQPIIQEMYMIKDKILLSVRYYSSIEERKDFYSKKGVKYCYWVICDLKDESVTYHTDYIINDLDGGPNILSPNFGNEDIYCLSVEDLKGDEEIYHSYFSDGVEAKLKDQEGKFQRLFEPLPDDANPIIRTYYWKE